MFESRIFMPHKIEPLEDDIHITVMEWVNINPKTKNYANLFIHIPNEGKRTYSYARRLQRLGMRKGASDLFIAYPSGLYHGAWLELKRRTGKLSEHQKLFLHDMTEQGYFGAVCYSIEEAMKQIEWYFSLDD
jgi:hypothetical protein